MKENVELFKKREEEDLLEERLSLHWAKSLSQNSDHIETTQLITWLVSTWWNCFALNCLG